MKIAIGYLSQVISAETIFRYYKLVYDLKNNDNYDVYWLIQEDKYSSEELLFYTEKYNISFIIQPNNNVLKNKYKKINYCWESNKVDVNTLDEKPVSEEEEKFRVYCDCGISFNCILNYVEFQYSLPNYDFYWCMEYDLIFNGNWKLFFDTIDKDKSDFIAEHFNDEITDVNICAKPHNRYVKYNTINYPEQRTAMLCICRFSSRLLIDLYKYYSAGEFGFMETLVPTFAHYNRYSMKDINAISKFYTRDRLNHGTITWSELYIKNRYFTNEPFYWNKQIKVKMYEMESAKIIEKDNLIYHPLKEDKISSVLFKGAK